MEISVILTPPVAEAKGNIRPVNPHFSILEGVTLTIGNERTFSNAYRVFDPYDDEERFFCVWLIIFQEYAITAIISISTAMAVVLKSIRKQTPKRPLKICL